MNKTYSARCERRHLRERQHSTNSISLQPSRQPTCPGALDLATPPRGPEARDTGGDKFPGGQGGPMYPIVVSLDVISGLVHKCNRLNVVGCRNSVYHGESFAGMGNSSLSFGETGRR